MFFIVGLIALAFAIAAIFGPQLHPVLMVFAFPVIATVYGGLTLIVCNLISSWLSWPEVSLPWWPQRSDGAVTISWYIIAGWLGAFIALGGYYERR
jgi:hypothetical protein